MRVYLCMSVHISLKFHGVIYLFTQSVWVSLVVKHLMWILLLREECCIMKQALNPLCIVFFFLEFHLVILFLPSLPTHLTDPPDTMLSAHTYTHTHTHTHTQCPFHSDERPVCKLCCPEMPWVCWSRLEKGSDLQDLPTPSSGTEVHLCSTYRHKGRAIHCSWKSWAATYTSLSTLLLVDCTGVTVELMLLTSQHSLYTNCIYS